MDRGERRRRTEVKSLRELSVRIRLQGWDTQLKAGYFKKWNAVSCRCRKHGRGCSPKVIASLCHLGCPYKTVRTGGYHPAVRERMEGKQMCRDWWLEY